MKPAIQINDFIIKGDLLEISLKIKFKNSKKYIPRLEIIFSNEIENRRFPFNNMVYDYDEISQEYFISVNEIIEINNIFWNKEFIGDITIDFSLLFGFEFINDFDIIDDVNFIHENNNYIPLLKENRLFLEVNVKSLKKINENKKNFKILLYINRFFLFIISILAFPFFFIDGILAFRGIRKKSDSYFKGNTSLKSILLQINEKTLKLGGFTYSVRSLKIAFMKFLFYFFKYKKIKKNKITFLSERNKDLNGNFKFIYNIIKEDKNLDINFFLKNKQIKNLSFNNMINYINIISDSQLILLDDFNPNIHNFKLKNETKLVQLWHAIGAFKTFGFSRMGKSGGLKQDSPSHRSYDYVTVSSDNIRRFYSEGFGISDEKVITSGIPRTDVFFDERYKEKITNKFFNELPKIKDKKIILFAPTFRGEGKDDAYYPMENFDLEKFFELFKKDGEPIENILLIIKHHPFISEKMKIPEQYKDNILDLSKESDINDLLFITDLLITDYSSVIFEASLLNIPMLFYSSDLGDYIENRGFYYDYNIFVPGKILNSLESLIKSIINNDFQDYKIQEFKNKFLKDLDGNSSKNVVEFLYNKVLKK